jgi:ABC-type lipoprotein export system ATPase subunit
MGVVSLRLQNYAILIQTKDLKFSYPGGQTMHFPDISLNKASGCLILGKSGSGKTTLLHLLAGIRNPSSGVIRIAGTALNDLSEKQRDAFRGRHIGIVFQKNHLLKQLTALENVQLAALAAGLKADESRSKELLSTLGLEKLISSPAYQLSLGEQQRVAIARALVNQPDVLLADEPTSALDDSNCREVVTMLQTACEKHQTALMIVTHDNRLKTDFNNHVLL